MIDPYTVSGANGRVSPIVGRYRHACPRLLDVLGPGLSEPPARAEAARNFVGIF